MIKYITLQFQNLELFNTSAIRGTSKEKLYNELGLETLEKKDGTGNFVVFLKTFTYQSEYIQHKKY